MTPPQPPGPYLDPYAYGYPPPRSTSGWAIASFVLGLLCCAPLGLIFGIIALIETKGGGKSGRGLAIAGIALSVVGMLVGGVIAAFFSLVAGTGDLVTGTENSSPLVTVGQCYKPDINYRVNCDQPHSDEVFAVLSLSRYPDADDLRKLEERCKAELPKYSPSASRDPNVQVQTWGPGTDWKYMDNHTTACAAHFTPDRVGSIKG